MLALQKGDAQIAQWLIKREGINLQEKNVEGLTALMMAVQGSHLEVVELLLAQPNITYLDLVSSLRYADTNKVNQSVQNLLRRHMIWLEGIREEKKIVIPAECYCPITQDIMIEPVNAPDGQTYEKQGITTWLNQKPFSPFSKKPMQVDRLNPSVFVKNFISAALKEVDKARDEALNINQDKLRMSSNSMFQIAGKKENSSEGSYMTKQTFM